MLIKKIKANIIFKALEKGMHQERLLKKLMVTLFFMMMQLIMPFIDIILRFCQKKKKLNLLQIQILE